MASGGTNMLPPKGVKWLHIQVVYMGRDSAVG